MTQSHLAIIGSGIAGLTLAVALRRQDPNMIVHVFESRPDPNENPYSGGAIMLSPNSLRVFDTLGAYSSIEAKACGFEQSEFLNKDLEVTGEYCFGSTKLFGCTSASSPSLYTPNIRQIPPSAPSATTS